MERNNVIVVAVLVVLAFLSGTLASSYGITPAAKPVPTLHTRLVSQPVRFSNVWNITSSCVGGGVTSLFNFTITFAGRDVGSDWVNFKPAAGGFGIVDVALVFNATNIPTNTGCLPEASLLSIVIFSGGSGDTYWRVLQPGTYAALTGFAAPTPRAVESWTLTTLS